MWFKRCWRYMQGEVRFRAEGGLCERFLNLLSEGDMPIRLWDMQMGDGAVTASCRASDYKRLRPFARRTGTRVRSVRYRGAVKTARPLRRHPGIFVGVMLAAMLYMWFASRIWVVEVTAEDASLCGAVSRVLEESGVGAGMPVKAVDLASVRMNVIASVPQVHHVSVYLEGCVARVDVTLADEEVELPDDTPANVVASRDGLIVSMRVSQGEKIAKVGEAVVAGDLLVCGATETAGGVLLRHAKAQVMAQTEHVLTASASERETVTVGGRVVVCPTVKVFSLSVPLFSSGADIGGCRVSREVRPLTLLGTQLPVSLETVRYTEPVETVVTRTASQTEALARERLQESLNTLADTAQIVSVDTQMIKEGETCRLTAKVTVIEDIAEERPLTMTGE